MKFCFWYIFFHPCLLFIVVLIYLNHLHFVAILEVNHNVKSFGYGCRLNLNISRMDLRFLLYLTDSWKHWMHCKKLCSISCWTSPGWGSYVFNFIFFFSVVFYPIFISDDFFWELWLSVWIYIYIYACFLLQPLGFKVDNTKLKRAGLDYWPYPFACSVT